MIVLKDTSNIEETEQTNSTYRKLESKSLNKYSSQQFLFFYFNRCRKSFAKLNLDENEKLGHKSQLKKNDSRLKTIQVKPHQSFTKVPTSVKCKENLVKKRLDTTSVEKLGINNKYRLSLKCRNIGDAHTESHKNLDQSRKSFHS